MLNTQALERLPTFDGKTPSTGALSSKSLGSVFCPVLCVGWFVCTHEFISQTTSSQRKSGTPVNSPATALAAFSAAFNNRKLGCGEYLLN